MKKGDNDWNLNNVTINRVFAPLVFLYYVSIEYFNNRTLFSGTLDFNDNRIYLCLISTWIYFFTSRFFQPDLDQTPHRPGKHSFPVSMEMINLFANIINLFTGIYKKRTIGAFLLILRPISLSWYLLWEPYAQALTHRGLSHIPVLGTMTRIGYLYGIYYGISLFYPIPDIHIYFHKALLLDTSDLEFFSYFILPIYFSDFVHESFDFIESVIMKGGKFCSSRNERGLISKILRLFGLKITI